MNIKKHFSPAHISIGIVCLLLAFFITMQIKSVSVINKNGNTDKLRAENLAIDLKNEQEKNIELNKQLLIAKQEIESFKEEAAKTNGYSQTLTTQLQRAELLAGLTAVEGSGVQVTLNDSTAVNNLPENANAYVIHDMDILQVINELRDAGAEAIAVNGERLVSTSEIRCAGATVSVNNNRYSIPYVITAIGDPVNMENALLMRNGVVDSLTFYGFDVEVKKVNSIKIAAYTGPLNYKYAVPSKITTNTQTNGGQ